MDLYESSSQSNAQVNPRPETYLTNDRLVNTGLFGLDRQTKINPELAIVSGPLSLQGEYSLALLDAPQLGNPSLWGSTCSPVTCSPERRDATIRRRACSSA
jgi:hypothetical protein